MLRVANIVGTRPNLVKMAAILAAQQARREAFLPLLIHTGQHSHPSMSSRFLAELDLPEPDVSLAGCTGGQAQQIGNMLPEIARVLDDLRPDLVLVVGDVNSTAAGALAAATLGIPVVHVEAGLRSFDRSMPEELNRILVDTVSEFLFASEPSGVDNLLREGRSREAIHHVGNVMIDALVRFRPLTTGRNPARSLGVHGSYGVLTLHRPSNVDNPARLAPLLRAIGQATRRLPIVFPVHPRTRDRLDASRLGGDLREIPGLHPVEPLGYVDMLALLEHADLVLTDSGGVQEETTYLGVPCLTVRDTTERPATVIEGTNRVIGTRPPRVVAEVKRILDGDRPPVRCPALWDGKAATRIVEILAHGAAGKREEPLVAQG